MSKSNQFICANSSASCDRSMPRPPPGFASPDSHAGIISQVPLGLSLPTSFVNCTHLTRPPLLSLSLTPCAPALLFAVKIIFAQFPTLFEQFARLFCSFFTSQIVDNVRSPLPLGHTPFVFAQRVCNLCEYKKNCQVSRKLTETEKLRAFHQAYELRERSKYSNSVEIK